MKFAMRTSFANPPVFDFLWKPFYCIKLILEVNTEIESLNFNPFHISLGKDRMTRFKHKVLKIGELECNQK